MNHTPDTAYVQRMITRALHAERQRHRTALLSAAQALGGSARAAVGVVARVIGKETDNA